MILNPALYLEKVVASPGIDVHHWCKVLSGAVGSDFEKIVNLAAFRSALDGKDMVENEHIADAVKRHSFGTCLLYTSPSPRD